MASDVTVSVDDDGIRRAINRVRQGMPLGGRMRPLWELIGRVLKTGAQLRFRTQMTPDGKPWQKSRRVLTEGGQTLSVSRRLRNSYTYEPTETSVSAGSNVAYAAMQHFGGVIRAKAGPFLAIPITPQARAAGSPRNFEGLHVAQSKGGQFMLVDEKGVTHYLLRKSVKLPARPALGVSDADGKEIVDTSERFYEGLWK